MATCAWAPVTPSSQPRLFPGRASPHFLSRRKGLSLAQASGANEQLVPSWTDPFLWLACGLLFVFRSLPEYIQQVGCRRAGEGTGSLCTHARQAGSTNGRFGQLDIASGGRQRPAQFHPLVNTHPHTHTHTQLQYSVSLVVTTWHIFV